MVGLRGRVGRFVGCRRRVRLAGTQVSVLVQQELPRRATFTRPRTSTIHVGGIDAEIGRARGERENSRNVPTYSIATKSEERAPLDGHLDPVRCTPNARVLRPHEPAAVVERNYVEASSERAGGTRNRLAN